MDEQFEIAIDLPEPVLEITEVRVTCGNTNVRVKGDMDRGTWDIWISHGYLAKGDDGIDARSIQDYQAAIDWARDYVVTRERRSRAHKAVTGLLG